jgi:hypothetical protein
MRFPTESSMHASPSPHPQSFVPSLEALEDRCVPSCTVRLRGDILTIRGDGSPHTIRILDNGTAKAGNVTIRCDGRLVTAKGAVRVVMLRTLAGGDRIDYSLTGNLGSGIQRVLDVSAGKGGNTFRFDLEGALLPRSSLALRYSGGTGVDRVAGTVRESLQSQATLLLDLHGGRGNDRINVDAAGSSVGFAAALVVNADGSGGNDRIGVNFVGPDQGVILARLAGDHGNDQVAADFTITNVGGQFRPVLSAQVTGRHGRDFLSLTVHRTDPKSPLLLNPTIEGGTGKDVAVHTANVVVRNVAKSVLVP